MTTLPRLAALPLIALSWLPACTAAELDELAGEAEDAPALAGKSDVGTDGTFTYFAIRGDARRCAAPLCGGFFLDRLNASKTTCHDGARLEECYTPELDWSESGLAQAQQDKLTGAAWESAYGAGVGAIVRGRFARTNLGTSVPSLGRFVVTEAWVHQRRSGIDAEGVFVKVRLNGVRCVAEPCASLTERALNSSRRMDIAELDFGAGDYADSALERLFADLSTPSGILVAGSRYTYEVEGREGKGRTATNAYVNLANDPADDGCFVAGCSGQLCTEDEGVVSTCEWREEYACYRDATCERQADGACGWTQDAALLACLGST